jgi:hypothetical protein
MRLLSKGFDGKWRIYDDHREEHVLRQLNQKIGALIEKFKGEENDDGDNYHLSQCERKTQSDDD